MARPGLGDGRRQGRQLAASRTCRRPASGQGPRERPRATDQLEEPAGCRRQRVGLWRSKPVIGGDRHLGTDDDEAPRRLQLADVDAGEDEVPAAPDPGRSDEQVDATTAGPCERRQRQSVSPGI